MRYFRTFALLFTTIVLLGGCAGEKKATSASGSGGSTGLPVDVHIVTPRPLDHKIFTTGTFLADEEIQIRPEISGRVVGLYFREGAVVRKGDLLVKLGDRDLAARLTRKDLEEKLAHDEERRAKQLHDVNGLSQEEYDRALTRLELIRAEREELRAEIAKTEITAPFDGVIGLRSISEGGYVAPSILVATLQDIDPIKVEFSVPEKYAGLMRNGLPIRAQVSGVDSSLTGTVYAVEARIDQSTRTLRARATIPNRDRSLVPGAFARIEVTLEHIAEALVVPSQALVPQIDGERAFVARGGKAVMVRVRTGLRTETGVHVTAGLTPQDSLIVTGLLQLTDGRSVKPTVVDGSPSP